ncbi:hypothetical protein SAMN02745157_0700 [Kaistia soli DSM 19436]|uniref:Phage P2 GpE n=1 Tax=Kaistia soli DSM 19436 TaxID=1122133 RepID=A0A1M4VGP4_9HYPH|nr:hypothetical protein [Kaistia soli]SHE68141.1 hypothetical protein SAMN02745157_0700 [Kaistia soli DSM 19436]
MDDPERVFLFALADHFGMPVADLETRLPHEELSEWVAWQRVMKRMRG